MSHHAQFGYKRFSGSKIYGQTFKILNLHSDPDPKHSNPVFLLEASGLYWSTIKLSLVEKESKLLKIQHTCCSMFCHPAMFCHQNDKMCQTWCSTCTFCHHVVTNHGERLTWCMVCHSFAGTTIIGLSLSSICVCVCVCVCQHTSVCFLCFCTLWSK